MTAWAMYTWEAVNRVPPVQFGLGNNEVRHLQCNNAPQHANPLTYFSATFRPIETLSEKCFIVEQPFIRVGERWSSGYCPRKLQLSNFHNKCKLCNGLFFVSTKVISSCGEVWETKSTVQWRRYSTAWLERNFIFAKLNYLYAHRVIEMRLDKASFCFFLFQNCWNEVYILCVEYKMEYKQGPKCWKCVPACLISQRDWSSLKIVHKKVSDPL